ncbi:hypothetical protein [Salininema proteolyticum]|uniref:Uncharacterized protein n=1 Tax=Salininema proteolyticum TaxID=1607685 RepID=A0ABV8TTH5_9ACTN
MTSTNPTKSGRVVHPDYGAFSFAWTDFPERERTVYEIRGPRVSGPVTVEFKPTAWNDSEISPDVGELVFTLGRLRAEFTTDPANLYPRPVDLAGQLYVNGAELPSRDSVALEKLQGAYRLGTYEALYGDVPVKTRRKVAAVFEFLGRHWLTRTEITGPMRAARACRAIRSRQRERRWEIERIRRQLREQLCVIVERQEEIAEMELQRARFAELAGLDLDQEGL